MIIAWYPGAGGNRFYQWLCNNKSFEQHRIYDFNNPFQFYPNRYPGRVSGQINKPVVFTHCMNYELITKTWPGHNEIYILDSDMQTSLRRQWCLVEQYTNANTHRIGGPFSAITWHTDYYTEYPMTPGNYKTVNNDTFPEFFKMMQQELNSIVCPEFDFANAMFEKYGKTAPILDLYKEYYEQR